MKGIGGEEPWLGEARLLQLVRGLWSPGGGTGLSDGAKRKIGAAILPQSPLARPPVDMLFLLK